MQEFDGLRFSFSAQGNVVVEDTVPTLATTFQNSASCGNETDDLAQRLYNSVVAVYEAVLGGVRCANGVGSTAFLHVDGPMNGTAPATVLVSIDVSYDGNVDNFDPFVILKEQFVVWRAANPCTTGIFDGSAPGTSADTTRDTSRAGTAVSAAGWLATALAALDAAANFV